MKDLNQDYWLRLRKGRKLALKGKQENAISGKQKDSVQREMHASFATTTQAWKQNTIVLSCAGLQVRKSSWKERSESVQKFLQRNLYEFVV